jgi:hypothetical protein
MQYFYTAMFHLYICIIAKPSDDASGSMSHHYGGEPNAGMFAWVETADIQSIVRLGQSRRFDRVPTTSA